MAARKRAREARIRVDADRVARDERIEAAAAEFFTADEELTRIIERLERVKARAVVKLTGEGESVARVAALVGVSEPDVRRLLRLGQAKRAGSATANAADEDSDTTAPQCGSPAAASDAA